MGLAEMMKNMDLSGCPMSGDRQLSRPREHRRRCSDKG
jgi:hypothetical protein